MTLWRREKGRRPCRYNQPLNAPASWAGPGTGPFFGEKAFLADRPWPNTWTCPRRIGESKNVAFRSAKVAAFAERKATKSEVIVSLILTGQRKPAMSPWALDIPDLPMQLRQLIAQVPSGKVATCGALAQHGRCDRGPLGRPFPAPSPP